MCRENQRRDKLQGLGKYRTANDDDDDARRRDLDLEATAFGDLTDRENLK